MKNPERLIERLIELIRSDNCIVNKDKDFIMFSLEEFEKVILEGEDE